MNLNNNKSNESGEAVMGLANEKIPVLRDKIDIDDDSTELLTTDDLDKCDIPTQQTSFNTCTRSGEDRRQRADRRGSLRAESQERRSGRDRRIFTYF